MGVSITGTIFLNATADAVWAALHDVDRIRLCVPGCQHLEHAKPDAYALNARVGLGPVNVAFDGIVAIVASEQPWRLVLTGGGGGGLAGAATGTADIALSDTRGGCRLSYRLVAEPTGPLSVVGTTFLTGVAQALADRFASRFAQLFASPTAGYDLASARR